MFGLNPTVMLVAALVAVASLSGAFFYGLSVGKEAQAAKCLRDVAKLNSQIKEANDRNRVAQRLRKMAFDDVLEERRVRVAQLAEAEEQAVIELQKQSSDYETELDQEREAARLKLSAYAGDIAGLADSCLLTDRDISRMRLGKQPTIN